MKIAIYCGSSFGNNEIYSKKAIEVAKALAKHKLDMVYGGSVSGLMGIISNEALKNGVKVTGVITHTLESKEISNKNLKELYKVNMIRERKALMESLSDAFIAMPGGYGTFEEIFEVISNTQMGEHKKPCAFYNINGYYDKLLQFLYSCSKEGFFHKKYVDMLIVSDNIEEIIEKIKQYKAPNAKWES